MKIVIFEDGGFEKLYPLTYLRPVFELRCGTKTLLERIKQSFTACEFSFFVRDCLKAKVEKKCGGRVNAPEALKDDVLLVNGRLLALKPGVLSGEDEEIAFCKDSVVWARVREERVAFWKGNTIEDFLTFIKESLPKKVVEVDLIEYPWELINLNPEAIEVDFKALEKKGIEGEFSPQAVVNGDKEAVYVAEGARVHPFVVLDTTNGPVIVEEEAELFPFARVEGPAVIGKNSQIMSGANIREGTTIGPVCRVGGEVEESVIQGYSNKYHEGFLGHAYVCEWVNLGGLTTNSDLKNDYSTVSTYINGELVDSGSTKVGSFIGDHSKTSIGVLLNTGAVIGVMCNVVAGGGIAPKFIPSFSWFINGKINKDMGLVMGLKTAETAMERRGRKLEDEDIKLLEYVRKLTEAKRLELVKKGRR